MHQDVQEKLFKEIDEILLSKSQIIDNNVISQMNYLDWVVKETHRLFPPGQFIGRQATDDLDLGDGLTIPAGANIMINYSKLQRNPKYWGSDAHLFKPERFEPENFKKIHPYAFIPFSAGPRNCIAFHYGSFMLRIALVQILRNFHLSTSMKYDEIKLETTVTMKVQQGYQIVLRRRLK
jgi:cytochrome P450